jgi:isopentenyl phosphate kinase
MEPSVHIVEIRNIPKTPASNYTDILTGGMNFKLENAVMLQARMEELVRL